MNTRQLTLRHQTQEFSDRIYKTKYKIRGLAKQKVNTGTKLEIKTNSEMYVCQTFFDDQTGREVSLYNQQYSLTFENERKVLTFLKNVTFVLKQRINENNLHATHTNKPVRYKHRKAKVQPTVFREGSLRKTKPALWLFTNS